MIAEEVLAPLELTLC